MSQLITFYLSNSEIARVNQMLVDTLSCIDSDSPEGTVVFSRGGEFNDGYEATLQVITARPTPVVEVVIYTDFGMAVAKDRHHATDILGSHVLPLDGDKRRYYVDVASREEARKNAFAI